MDSESKHIPDISRESKEHPDVEWRFRFAHHGEVKDLDGLEKELESADIFIPESFAWNEDQLSMVNQISQGTLTPEEMFKRIKNPADFSDYKKAELALIYGSKKPVVFVDLQENHPLVMETLNARKYASSNIPRARSFSEVLQVIKEGAKRQAQTAIAREDYILEHLPDAIQKSLTINPGLHNKGKIKALVSLGSAHTPVFHALSRVDDSATRVFGKLPETTNFLSEAENRARYDKEITDELAARSLLEMFYVKAFENSLATLTRFKGSAARDELIRKNIGAFSLDEIRDFTSDPLNRNNFRDAFSRVLKRKGIKQHHPTV